MRKSIVTLLLVALFGLPSQSGRVEAQVSSLSGEYLVQLRDNATPGNLKRRFELQTDGRIEAVRHTAEFLNCWLLQFSDLALPDAELLAWLRAQPEVAVVQPNFRLADRSAGPQDHISLPNDPLFQWQWHFLNTGANGGMPGADLHAIEAWDITTGGLTPAGDTIVVAVIDRGMEWMHPDLAPNLWINRGEIPGDGQDNDANGYIDDYRGWNVYAGNDNIMGAAAGHGTAVSGVIGARGNNGAGVTGVNWHVKILFVAGSGLLSDVLASYDYLLKMRRTYNQTQGAQGAFVTAVNCSWGLDYGQPADAPLWCAALDSLGAAGILSVSAAPNNPVNIDVVGDLPAACPSAFQVVVTSLDHTDQKAPDAGWGSQHVDLGAYGAGIYTTGTGQSYAYYNGTSFAAPQVAGAIGLLYAAPSSELIAVCQNNPKQAALWAKSLILNGVAPNASLYGITKTGGRLQLLKLLETYQNACTACPAPFSLKAHAQQGDSSVVLSWQTPPGVQSVNLRRRPKGQPDWAEIPGAVSPFLWSGLSTCQEYEYALQSVCTDTLSGAWTPPRTFVTGGCCVIPAVSVQVSGQTATFSWNYVADAYQVFWRVVGEPWQVFDTDTAYWVVSSLAPCTDYELAVQALCAGNIPVFSPTVSFASPGCGACLDLAYCTAAGHIYTEEWIAGVQIGDWQHLSGSGGGGYQNFAQNAAVETLTLAPGASLPVLLTPAFGGAPYKEYFRIYIDFNADGDFTDAGELAFDPFYAHNGPVSGILNVPPDVVAGLTRMRVLMKFKGPLDTPPQPCEIFEHGQVEDYCVTLMPLVSSDVADDPAFLQIWPQPASDRLYVALPKGRLGQGRYTVFDLSGRWISSGVCEAAAGFELPVHDWLPGIYVLALEWEGRMYRRRIVVL